MLVPVVFQQVARRYAADKLLRPYTQAVLPLTVVSGVAELPNNVIVEALKFGTLANPADDTQTKKYTYIASWADFSRPLTPVTLQLGYFTVVTQMTGDFESDLYVVEPGSVYAPGAGFSGNMILTTPVVPLVPVNANDPVNAPQQLQQEIQKEGGIINAMPAQMPWKEGSRHADGRSASSSHSVRTQSGLCGITSQRRDEP